VIYKKIRPCLNIKLSFGFSKDSDKTTSSNYISAHERLFGSSKESSLSPPSSPDKSCGSSRVNSISPVTSPIYKSAAARAIIEEMGKDLVGSSKKRIKKRYTYFAFSLSVQKIRDFFSDHKPFLAVNRQSWKPLTIINIK